MRSGVFLFQLNVETWSFCWGFVGVLLGKLWDVDDKHKHFLKLWDVMYGKQWMFLNVFLRVQLRNKSKNKNHTVFGSSNIQLQAPGVPSFDKYSYLQPLQLPNQVMLWALLNRSQLPGGFGTFGQDYTCLTSQISTFCGYILILVDVLRGGVPKL